MYSLLFCIIQFLGPGYPGREAVQQFVDKLNNREIIPAISPLISSSQPLGEVLDWYLSPMPFVDSEGRVSRQVGQFRGERLFGVLCSVRARGRDGRYAFYHEYRGVSYDSDEIKDYFYNALELGDRSELRELRDALILKHDQNCVKAVMNLWKNLAEVLLNDTDPADIDHVAEFAQFAKSALESCKTSAQGAPQQACERTDAAEQKDVPDSGSQVADRVKAAIEAKKEELFQKWATEHPDEYAQMTNDLMQP